MLSGWPELKGKKPNMKNWCSLFFLTHLYRLFPIKRAYQLEEIAPSDLDARQLVDEAERLWMKHAESGVRLWKSMFEQFYGYVMGIGLMCLGKGLGNIALAILMKVVIVEMNTGITKTAIGGCAGLVILDFFIVSFDRLYVGFSMFLSMRVRVVITGLIYRKLMKTKVSALQFTSDGQLSNFVGADVERLFLCIMPMQYVWVSPVILIVVVAIIYVQCGSSALVGYVGVAILLIIQGLPVRVMGYFRLQSAVLGDRRLALTNEAIEAIHLIKACVWESAISQHIDKARWVEVKAKIYQSCCEAVKDVFTNINRLVVLVFVTLIWTLIGEEISSSTIFPLSSLYSTSCTWFPSNFIWGLQDVVYAKVSMKRVQEFLELSDQEADDTVNLEVGTSFDSPIYPGDNSRRPVVHHNVSEVMVRDSNGTLIDLGPKSGKLIGLAGPSASGKTTFMKDLMGFRKGGTIDTIKTSDGRIGYAPQSAWIFPATLRENILAGLPFQSQRYWDVIRACCLDEDLRNLKFGDQTRVGFGGITLSGGQQARVSLARAVYCNADIYVIDDPFSAINQKIAKRIFKLCFQQYLEGKTRLVVLHEDSFLSSCDATIIFPITGGPGSGGDVVSGTEHSYQDYAARKLNQLLSESENEADVFSDIERRRQRGDAYTYGVASASEAEGADGRSRGGRRRFSPAELSKKLPDGDSPLYHKFGEELSKSVSWRIYWQWCKAANPFIVALLFCNFAGARALVNISDLWLTSWTGDDCDEYYTSAYYDNSTGECDTTLLNWYYFKHYVVLVLAALALAIPLGMGWRIAFMLAADRVHRRMIRSVLRTPMKVIMEKSYGEISNRFSRDVNGVDWVVIFMSFSFLDGFSSIISYLVIILMMNTYVLIGLVPAVICILIIRAYYLRCTRQIARLEAEAKSPYFTHFNTSFNGLPTARALKLEANMVTDFHKFQNVFISVVSVFLDLLLWLDLMVGLCGVFFMAVVSFSCLIISGLSDSSSTVGLVLMYTLTLLENMQKNVRESAEVDNKMVHTERCLEFTKLPREEPDRGSQLKPKEDDEAFSSIRPFPIRNGQISAQRCHLRYSIDSPWVLKDFNLDIQAGEKIGLAGRTGCGKSSFLNVILRMYEFDGVVLIDGTDIKGLSLASLRKGISIMTQFPIIFSMTLRQNLDPNETTRDDEMWRALEMVGLKDLVLRMPQGIDTEITPHALEWSAGQKQLFCMARTLLEGRKIVLMDEPTSSLDNVTGKLLWDKTVEIMKDCTVIIVSHMPSQLTFCNRIINMDAKADASL